MTPESGNDLEFQDGIDVNSRTYKEVSEFENLGEIP